MTFGGRSRFCANSFISCHQTCISQHMMAVPRYFLFSHFDLRAPSTCCLNYLVCEHATDVLLPSHTNTRGSPVCVQPTEGDTAHHILPTFSPLPRCLTNAAEVSSYHRFPPDTRYPISSMIPSADDVVSLRLIMSACNDSLL